MAEYLSPGVYVEEFDSGGVPMQGVSTSTAGFVGFAEKGPVGGIPLLVTSFADFKRKFGGYLSEKEFGEYRFLAYAVEHFFINGGARAYITRAKAFGSEAAAVAIDKLLTICAKNPGEWGNSMTVTFKPSSKAKSAVTEDVRKNAEGKIVSVRVKSASGFAAGDVVLFTDNSPDKKADGTDNTDKLPTVCVRIAAVNNDVLDLETPLEKSYADTSSPPLKLVSTCEFDMDVVCGDSAESYECLSLNDSASNYILKRLEKSELISIEFADPEEPADPPETLPPYNVIAGKNAASSVKIALSGGTVGTPGENAGGITASLMGADNGPGKRTGIKAFLDIPNVSLMAVPGVTTPSVLLDLVSHCEKTASRFAVLDMPKGVSDTGKLGVYRNYFDTQYAALYHPWLQVFDALENRNIYIPPSGSVLGIYARSDTARGVHKAPANEVVRNCVGLDVSFGKGEQDVLNPVGINLIRAFPGQGIRVWGARTASSNGLWKYVNVRRLFIYVEESIRANTNWVVFEPNDGPLWARVKRTIEVFLTTTWRSGALQGASSAEAFYVRCGLDTMTQDDIDNGRLICEVGIAPVKPAEFVIFRITQKTAT